MVSRLPGVRQPVIIKKQFLCLKEKHNEVKGGIFLKSNIKKVLCALLAGAMMLGAFAGCNNAPASGGGNSDIPALREEPLDVVNDFKGEENTMNVTVSVMTGFTQSDSTIEKELEEKYNINIELQVLPGWNDGQQQIRNLMSATDTMPNIIWWWSMDSDYGMWKDAGFLVDVSDYMNRYTNMRDYYNKMDPMTLFYATETDGAIYRIPGDVAEPSCECLWIRQDWLDALNLEAPTTVEELGEVMAAFTEQDPDGNGKDDTYGMNCDGEDFRSFWPWIQGYDYTHYERFTVDDQGKVYYGPAHPNTQKWLAECADLYAKGYIDPNIITNTDRDQEMAKGGFGVTYSWCAYNNPDSQTMISFYANNPDAEWVPIDMVVGENGNPQEDPATSAAWAYFGITQTCSDPERLYAIWDDMNSLDNYIHRRWGTEGEHYTMEDGVYTPIVGAQSQENNEQNIGLYLFDNLFNRKDEGNIANTAETKALFDKSGENSRDRYNQLVEWQDPNFAQSWKDNGTNIGDAAKKYMWSVIGGQADISDEGWNAYIESLNGYGLEQVLADAQEVYDGMEAAKEEYVSNNTNNCNGDAE